MSANRLFRYFVLTQDLQHYGLQKSNIQIYKILFSKAIFLMHVAFLFTADIIE